MTATSVWADGGATDPGRRENMANHHAVEPCTFTAVPILRRAPEGKFEGARPTERNREGVARIGSCMTKGPLLFLAGSAGSVDDGWVHGFDIVRNPLE